MKRFLVILVMLVTFAVFGIGVAQAYLAVNNVQALDRISDLTIPTSSQKYPMGMTVKIYDSTKKAEKEFVYVRPRIALTAYRAYTVDVSSQTGGEYNVAVPTCPAYTTTGPLKLVCVPQVAFTQNYYGFVQTKGDCTIYCVSHSTVGTLGKVISGATTGIGVYGESSTANTNETVYSIGISKKTAVITATTTYYLFGKPKRISYN